MARSNVIFRIPTPLFGAGLIEQIPDSEILANRPPTAAPKQALGIGGRPNVAGLGATDHRSSPTATATTARSRASAGRRRTSRC